MIVMIDNYDSFTYNLVQYFGEFEPDIRVYRNDAIDPDGIRALNPTHVVVSPGPCTPKEAGISIEAVKQLGPDFPLLGVCLGHQSIGAAFGGNIIRADVIMHGKVSQVSHTGDPLFANIESPFTATRYHSLIIERETCPDSLDIIAETDDGTIMAAKHIKHPIWGLQFHPESILTNVGKQIIQNFLGRS